MNFIVEEITGGSRHHRQFWVLAGSVHSIRRHRLLFHNNNWPKRTLECECRSEVMQTRGNSPTSRVMNDVDPNGLPCMGGGVADMLYQILRCILGLMAGH